MNKQRAALSRNFTSFEIGWSQYEHVSGVKAIAFDAGYLGYIDDDPDAEGKVFYPDHTNSGFCFGVDKGDYELLWTDYKPEFHGELEEWRVYVRDEKQHEVAAKLFDMEKEIETLKIQLAVRDEIDADSSVLVKQLNRIMSLTLIKDVPEDTAYDALYKIGKEADSLLLKYSKSWRELREKHERKRREAIEKEEAERKALWDDMRKGWKK